ncbi:MAG TPA: XTP/dITP diphosphatase [Sedimentisphaerales bacterium]|nr:XTP/dITP diphosphatase [Sedimentisphaerales bacterium]
MFYKDKNILVATTNPGKIVEIRAMLDLDVECTSLSDFPGIQKIKEDGATFAENARKKAVGYAKTTGLWTLADDSGLVVDVLGGAPGVNSARFSGQRSSDRRLTDLRNIEKLLRLLEGVPEQKRTARFVCCLCLASAEKVLIETEGALEGLITQRPRGENGFGYDPIFFVPSLQKTVAELSSAEKNAISHRGNAIRQLRPLLQELLQKG